MKARIAMFGWTRWPNWTPTPRSDQESTKDTDYTRISEWVEVEFPELPKEEAIAVRVGVLEEERREVVQKFGEKLKDIDDRLAELRCLPAPQPPAATSEPPPIEEESLA